jgi:carboxylate-amine ligase
MSSQTEEFTIGVEEEYQIINPVTRELRSRVRTHSPKSPESAW